MGPWDFYMSLPFTLLLLLALQKSSIIANWEWLILDKLAKKRYVSPRAHGSSILATAENIGNLQLSVVLVMDCKAVSLSETI